MQNSVYMQFIVLNISGTKLQSSLFVLSEMRKHICEPKFFSKA
jgi:hypothetical protein